ncbi:MAG: class I SAM-dependent methyltransferase [Planctomycetaceae bacterium]
MVSSLKVPESLETCIHFARGFLERPAQVASLLPSSRFLEEKLATAAGIERAGTIVELGPGSGGTTRAFLQRMSPASRLLAIEIVSQFMERLRSIRDTRLLLHEGDALQLTSILRAKNVTGPEVIVSGIPFTALGNAAARSLIEQIHQALAPGGRFLAYQVSRRVEDFAQACFGPPEVVREFRNFPPLWIYRWQKNGS